MLVLFGEFVLCCFIVIGSILIAKSHLKIAEGIFLTYAIFIVINYFVSRVKLEILRYKVRKFKKLRKKVTNFDFGMPAPPPLGKTHSQTTTPNKPK